MERLVQRSLMGLIWLVTRRPGWTLAILLSITVVLGAVSAVRLGLQTDTADMISRQVPFRQHYEDYKKAFPQFADLMVVVIDGQTPEIARDATTRLEARLREEGKLFRSIAGVDPFLIQQGMLYMPLDQLARTADRLVTAQPMIGALARDPSLRGLAELLTLAVSQGPPGDALAGDFARVLDALADQAEGAAAGQRVFFSWQDAFDGTPSTESERRGLLLVQVNPDYASLSPSKLAMSRIRAAAAEIGLTVANGVRVRLTGSPALNTEELDSVMRSAGIANVVSLLLVMALLGMALRSARLFAANQAMLLVGLVWTLGFAALAIGHLNLISVTFAVLFIGLGGDFGMHFALRFKEEIRAGSAPRQGLIETAAEIGPALGLCTVAACIGFLSFAPTDYVGLAELGVISAAGMVLAFLATMTVLPPILVLMPPWPDRTAFPETRRRMAVFLERRAAWIAGGGVVLALAALPSALALRFDYNPVNLKDPNSESVLAFRDLIGDPLRSPYVISVVAENLDQAEDLAARLKALPQVRRAITLNSYVPAQQAEKLEILSDVGLLLLPSLAGTERRHAPSDAERRAALAGLRGAVAAMPEGASPLHQAMARLVEALDRAMAAGLDLAAFEAHLMSGLPRQLATLATALGASPFTVADLPPNLRSRHIAPDGRAIVTVQPRDSLEDQAALDAFVGAVQAVAPAATGSAVVMREAGKTVSRAFVEAGIYAVAGIALLLLILLRSVRDTILVMLPLVLAGELTAAAAVLLGVPLNFANMIAIPLIFGLGVDSGIHIVLRGRRTANLAALAETTTPRAVLFSSLTTIASFGSFAGASHAGIASMGVLLTLSITMTLFTTLLLLPAFQSLVVRWRHHQAAAAAVALGDGTR